MMAPVRVSVRSFILLLVANSVFASQGSIQVVGMSVDPSLLERAGLTVADLKTATVAQLKSAGIEADMEERPEARTPRLAIAIPVTSSGGEMVAFVLLQYQTPARLQKPPAALVYATTWSRWWGGNAKKEAIAGELKRGLRVLVEQFIAAYQKGAL